MYRVTFGIRGSSENEAMSLHGYGRVRGGGLCPHKKRGGEGFGMGFDQVFNRFSCKRTKKLKTKARSATSRCGYATRQSLYLLFIYSIQRTPEKTPTHDTKKDEPG